MDNEYWAEAHEEGEENQPIEAENQAAEAQDPAVEDDSSSWATASGSDDTSHLAEGEQGSNRGCMQKGCTHYKRRCKLVASCCGEVFWCRHCHNHVKDEGELVRRNWVQD
jgi:RING finger/CHY zinc finger protein 1